MRTESYEILMPEKARLMTEEEMEYEGLGNLIRGAIFGALGLGTKKTVKMSVNNVAKMADLGVLGLSIALPYVGAAGIVTFGAAALNASEIIGDTSLGKEYAKYLDSIDGRSRDRYVTFDVTIV